MTESTVIDPPQPETPPSLAGSEALAHHLERLGDVPSWLAELKRESWEQWQSLPWPNRKSETWRFGTVSDLAVDGFHPAAERPPASAGDLEGLPAAARFVFVDDALVHKAPLDEAWTDRGVIVCTLAEALRDCPERLREHLFGRFPDIGSAKFQALHAALFRSGVFVYVPSGVVLPGPVVVEHFTGRQDRSAIFPHTLVVAESDSGLELVDRFASLESDTTHFICGLADVHAGAGAKVGYHLVQEWNLKSLAFHLNAFSADRDAELRAVSAHLGGRHVRNEQHGRILGAGASIEMFSLGLASAGQEVDQRTLQTHSAPHGRSNLLFKNVLQETGRTIFSGLIRVDEVAQKTDAYQSNRNLILSPEADANSLPGLEIRANDVRCTHGATTAEPDREELFYLKARGIPAAQAHELLVFGFLDEIITKIGLEPLSDFVRERLSRRLHT